MSEQWCRSCGAGQPGDVAACAACGVDLGDHPPDLPHVGLVFSVPGKLRVNKRLGICTQVDGDTAYLHVDAKEKEKAAVLVASLPAPEAIVPSSLSPVTRLIYATRHDQVGIKEKWDKALLLQRAAELATGSIREMRAVADTALARGWDDIVDWTRLTDAEKAWRRAHHAAAGDADLDTVAEQLGKLPAAGYHARVGLLLPHLPKVREHAACRQLVGRWHDAGLPGAGTVHRLLGEDWQDGMAAGIELFPDASAERRTEWSAALEALDSGDVADPVGEGGPRWRAARVVVRGRSGENVNGDLPPVAENVSLSLIDDLIDSGGVDERLDVSFAGESDRRYLLARLRPQALSTAEVAQVGHDSELARRRFLAGDESGLRALPDSPAVAHYRALLDVALGKKPDPERLRDDAAGLLELAARAVSAIAGGKAGDLPGPVAKDPSLWSMFAEYARSGDLSPDAETRRTHPELANWCDLYRLVGLLWDERWNDAIAFGERVADVLDEEEQQDEALSLTAYALLRTGRGEDAIAKLEKAMAGSYTEALLVNLSVAAAEARPEVAAAHFARIMEEAPSHELRLAAMRRAIDVWGASTDGDFPAELVGPLESLLGGECSVEDYASFVSLAAHVAPEVVLRISPPAGERGSIHRLHKAWARQQKESGFLLAHYANEIVAVYQEAGRPDWFNEEWGRVVRTITDSVFVDFGKAGGSAEFIDEIHQAAPELFTQQERFILLPQAGAHLAGSAADNNAWLTDDAMTKFFFRPIEEFLAERSKIDSGMAEIAADNFFRALFYAGIAGMQTARDQAADEYNAFVDRARWDSANRMVLINAMRQNLGKQTADQESADRVIDRLQRLGVDTEDSRKKLGIITEALADWRAETVRLRANL